MSSAVVLFAVLLVACNAAKFERQVAENSNTNSQPSLPLFTAAFRLATSGAHFCQGAVLDDDWLLTSKDCAQFGQAQGSDIKVQYATRKVDTGKDTLVFQWIEHETENLALVRVADPFAESVRSIPLGQQTHDTGDDHAVLSYGCQDPACAKTGTAHSTPVATIPVGQANSRALQHAALGNDLLDVTTKHVYGTGAMCLKDWGAPLYRTVDGVDELVGIYVGNGPSQSPDLNYDACGESALYPNALDVFVNVVDSDVKAWVQEKMSCPELWVQLSNPRHGGHDASGTQGSILSVCTQIPTAAVGSATEIRLEFPSDGWNTEDVVLHRLRGVDGSAELDFDDNIARLRFDSALTVSSGNPHGTIRFQFTKLKTPNNCDKDDDWEMGFYSCSEEPLLGFSNFTVRQCPETPLAQLEQEASGFMYSPTWAPWGNDEFDGYDVLREPNVGCRYCENTGEPLNIPADCSLCTACKQWFQYSSASGDLQEVFECEMNGRRFVRSNLAGDCGAGGSFNR